MYIVKEIGDEKRLKKLELLSSWCASKFSEQLLCYLVRRIIFQAFNFQRRSYMGRQQPSGFTAQDRGGSIQYRRLICGQRLHSWKRPQSPRRRRGCRKVSSVKCFVETQLNYGKSANCLSHRELVKNKTGKMRHFSSFNAVWIISAASYLLPSCYDSPPPLLPHSSPLPTLLSWVAIY